MVRLATILLCSFCSTRQKCSTKTWLTNPLILAIYATKDLENIIVLPQFEATENQIRCGKYSHRQLLNFLLLSQHHNSTKLGYHHNTAKNTNKIPRCLVIDKLTKTAIKTYKNNSHCTFWYPNHRLLKTSTLVPELEFELDLSVISLDSLVW